MKYPIINEDPNYIWVEGELGDFLTQEYPEKFVKEFKEKFPLSFERGNFKVIQNIPFGTFDTREYDDSSDINVIWRVVKKVEDVLVAVSRSDIAGRDSIGNTLEISLPETDKEKIADLKEKISHRNRQIRDLRERLKSLTAKK